CARCATEAAAYSRLGHALAVMANLEVDPADGTLERILVAIGRRRTGVKSPRHLPAAPAARARARGPPGPAPPPAPPPPWPPPSWPPAPPATPARPAPRPAPRPRRTAAC